MSYQLSSIQSVLGYLNKANSTSFVAADLSFGTPVATGGTWHGNTTARNSAVKVSAGASGKYQGSVSIVYDRLDLGALSNLPGFTIFATNPTKISDLFVAIHYYNGITLTAADVVDSALTANGDGTFSGTLTALSTSLGWTGSFAITVKPGGARLDQTVTDTTLDGLNYPTVNDTDTYGPLYLYPYDFTTYYSDISALTAGVLTAAQATTLATDIAALDISSGKALWNGTVGSTTWALSGATVVSNGLNGSDLPTNPAYKYVLVLALASGVTIPNGNLYLHYNDPVNANAV